MYPALRSRPPSDESAMSEPPSNESSATETLDNPKPDIEYRNGALS